MASARLARLLESVTGTLGDTRPLLLVVKGTRSSCSHVSRTARFVLTLGNTLNQGHAGGLGGAVAVRVGSLCKVAHQKATDGGTTLLDFLVKVRFGSSVRARNRPRVARAFIKKGRRFFFPTRAALTRRKGCGEIARFSPSASPTARRNHRHHHTQVMRVARARLCSRRALRSS